MPSNPPYTSASNPIGAASIPRSVLANPFDKDNNGIVDQAESALSADAVAWANVTGKPSTFSPDAHNHGASAIVSGTFDDARVAASNVTQHQAALSINTSQLTAGVTLVNSLLAVDPSGNVSVFSGNAYGSVMLDSLGTAVTTYKNNLAAAVAPGTSDDAFSGYTVGSRWIDTTADKEYVCLDSTNSAAVWTETTQGGSSLNIGGLGALPVTADSDLLVVEDATDGANKQCSILQLLAHTHNHAAGEIISGTLAHERGGLEADVSAYSGLLKVSGGTTSAVTDNSANWNTAFGWGDHSVQGYLTSAMTDLSDDLTPTFGGPLDSNIWFDEGGDKTIYINDRASGAGRNLTIRAGHDDALTGTGGNLVCEGGDDAGGGGTGGNVILRGGEGDTGGYAELIGGASAGTTGGQARVFGGDGVSADGDVLIRGGEGIDGGAVTVRGGNGTGSGGLTLLGGDSTGADGGDVKLGGGDSSGGNGGNAYIYAGSGFSVGDVMLGHSGVSALGNVGVRKTGPAEALDVSGNVQATGFKHDGSPTNDRFLYWSAGTLTEDSTAKSDYKTTRTGVRREHWFPASSLIPKVTAGAEAVSVEMATNDIQVDYFDFDPATDEGVGFWVDLGDLWDASGGIKMKIHWTAASGSGDVVWTAACRRYSDSSALDAAVSTAANVTDTLITADDEHLSSAITLNTTGTGALVYFEVTRDADNGSDTLAVDARLIGVTIQVVESSTEPSAW